MKACTMHISVVVRTFTIFSHHEMIEEHSFFFFKQAQIICRLGEWLIYGNCLYTDFEFWISMLACLTLLSSYSNIPHAKLLEYSYIQPSLYYCPVRKCQCLHNYLQYNIQKFHFLKLFFTNSIRIRENVLWRTESVTTISLASNL